MRNKRRSLRLDFRLKRLDTFLIVGVSMLLVFVLILFHLFTYSVKNSEHQLISLVLERMSENQKTQFETYIDEKIQVMEALVTFPEVYEMRDTNIKNFLGGKAKEFGFEYFFLMKASGVGYYFDENVYRNQAEEQFFRDIMEHDVYLTEPFYTDKGPAITTACVSIYDAFHDKVGVLCAAINLENIQTIIEESEMVLDGSCFILNQEGNYISSNTHKDVHSESSIFNTKDSELSLIRQAFESKEDLAGSITVEGVEYEAYLTYLSDFNWVIVQSIPMSEITARFAYVEVMQVLMSILTIALFACIVRIIYSWKRSDKKIYTDMLTGCSSRAACLSLIESLEDQRNMRISIVYMDLNKFKFVNDTYGHDKGDKLLRIFGSTLNKVFGPVGFVGRMGGDEFIAILADVNDSEIQRLCKEVEELLWEKSKTLDFPYVISSSYGYASRNVGQPETMDEIMQIADEYMYKHKAASKNKE